MHNPWQPSGSEAKRVAMFPPIAASAAGAGFSVMPDRLGWWELPDELIGLPTGQCEEHRCERITEFSTEQVSVDLRSGRTGPSTGCTRASTTTRSSATAAR